MRNWSHWLVVIIVGLSFTACSGKGSKGGRGKAKGNPGATEPAADPKSVSDEIDQNLSQFKIIKKDSVNDLVQLTVLDGAESIVLKGLLAPNTFNEMQTDHTDAFAYIHSFDGMRFVAAITGRGTNNDAKMFIFFSNDGEDYTLLTEGIAVERSNKFSLLIEILIELSKNGYTDADLAFGSIVAVHLENRKLNLKEIAEKINAKLAEDNEDTTPDDDPTEGDDFDDGDDNNGIIIQKTKILPVLESDLNDNVIIRYSTWDDLPPQVQYSPSIADETAPWREDFGYNGGYGHHSDYDNSHHRKVDPRSSGKEINVISVPVIPQADEKGFHTWPQCFASKVWSTESIWRNFKEGEDGKEDIQATFCSNKHCTNRKQECCAPIDAGGKCRILEASTSQLEYVDVEVDGDSDYDQNYGSDYNTGGGYNGHHRHHDRPGHGSLRVLCAHDRKDAAGSFKSGSYVYYKDQYRRIHTIDKCISSNGKAEAYGAARIYHEGALFGLGRIAYYGGVDITISVDFSQPSTAVHRMIEDVSIHGPIPVRDERTIVKGMTRTEGRAEFLKTFYMAGRPDQLDSVNLACEAYYYESENCQ